MDPILDKYRKKMYYYPENDFFKLSLEDQSKGACPFTVDSCDKGIIMAESNYYLSMINRLAFNNCAYMILNHPDEDTRKHFEKIYKRQKLYRQVGNILYDYKYVLAVVYLGFLYII